MTRTEILLLEKIIESAVKKAVNEALQGEVKKDIKDLKMLTARILKESRQNVGGVIKESFDGRTITRDTNSVAPVKRAKLPDNVKMDDGNPYAAASVVLPATVADRFVGNDDIPADLDAPIYFDKNSSLMHEIKEKFNK